MYIFLKRLSSIATLVSLVLSFVPFIPAAQAQFFFGGGTSPFDGAPLKSLTTTLSNPTYSTDWDVNPSLTNVTYAWKQNNDFIALAGDACIAANDCFEIGIVMQDEPAGFQQQGPTTSTHAMQEWMSSLVPTDITLVNGPVNASIASVELLDVGFPSGNGRYETLRVVVSCSDACTFAANTEYKLSIVHSPIKNPMPPMLYGLGSYKSLGHTFILNDMSESPAVTEGEASIVAIGKGLTITANVDPTLTFSVVGFETPASYYGESVSIDNSATPDTCDFGVLTPTSPKVCAWYLNIATNASNGYSIYVVQDQDMTFNGNSIKQFKDGTRIDDTVATEWTVPASVQLAHLGYSSNDADIFPPTGGTVAVWAGIPTVAAADAAPVATGLVASNNLPESHQYTYAIKIESAATLPQGTGYTHHEYFMVVGNF